MVATNVGGIPDLIEDGITGRLVAPSDAEAAARGLVAALDGGAEIERQVAEAGRRLQRFDAATAAETHERIYRDAIALRAGGKPWQRPR